MWDDRDETEADDHARLNSQVKEHDLSKHAPYRRLLADVAAAVRKSGSSRPADDLYNGFGVVEQIMRSVNERGWSTDPQNARVDAWHHQDRPRLAPKKRLEPWIRTDDVADAAAMYLDLSYRVPSLDRLIMDMLIAAEMYAYADEVQPLLKRKLPLLLSWVVSNVTSLVGGLGIAGIILWLFPNSTAAEWAAGIIAALTLLSVAWSLIAFPFLYPTLRERLTQVRSLTGAMLDANAALGGSPASIRHVRGMIEKGVAAGVVWPSQLFVLLEDIEARRSTI